MGSFGPIVSAIAIGLVCAILTLPWALRTLRRWRVTQRSSRGERIITGGGIALVVSAAAGLVLAQLLRFDLLIERIGWVHLLAIAVMGVIGLAQDLQARRGQPRPGLLEGLGRRRPGRRQRLITATLVVAASVFIVRQLGHADVRGMLLNGGLVLLSVHLLTLVDTGPGRTLKAYWLLYLPLLLLGDPEATLKAAPLLVASLLIAPYVLSGRAALGSAGALVLGASIGVLLVTSIHGAWFRVLALLVLLVLSLCMGSESMGWAIGSRSGLGAIDRMGRRAAPEGNGE